MDQQPNFYRLSGDECLKNLHTTRDGLVKNEAAWRLEHLGANVLQAKHKESRAVTYLRQFKDLMIILLLVSSGVSFFLGDFRTGAVLIGLVFFNTTLGLLQEYKAERVMESLEKLTSSRATVMRDAKLKDIDATELVAGDVVYIEEGAAVPADLRLIAEDELSTNDFALTGESNPSRKFLHAISAEVPLANRHNLVFMGTTVATGHGFGLVIATGMRTELGRIAALSQETRQELSPLQKETNNIATRVTQGTVILCVILLPVAINAGLAMKEALLFAIGIASSIIPQGLPAEINTALAGAAGKLARARALVRKLSAVETLGATSVICTDKTGTLTKNQMTVEQFMIGNQTYHTTGTGYEANGEITDDKNRPLDQKSLTGLKLFFDTGALASNAHVNPPDDEHAVWYCIGDPTEGALVTLAQKAGISADQLSADNTEIKEFAFDSARKLMSSVRRYGPTKEVRTFVKGAPENLLARCTHVWDGSEIHKLTEADRKFWSEQNTNLAGKAMRNLGFACRVLPSSIDTKKLKMDEVENDLTWLGMACLIDPLREEVPAAMEAARAAHIKVAIVTGDFAITARAIAARAKMTANPDNITVVSGEELQKLSDAQVLSLVESGGAIFSRVSPEDKLRIVALVKDSGRVVAVTGDGINDAPALRRADIGVAMGETGTDVAKQSAEIILLDDSFHTLIGAVQQGRVIFQNIKKGTLSCFTSNAAELVVNLTSLAATTLMHVPLAMSVMQILAIDLIAEIFPIAALGGDKGDGELMNDNPRDPHDHILNLSAIVDLLWCGVIIGGFAFANYMFFFTRNGIDSGTLANDSLMHYKATTLTYLTIVLCQLFNILQRRSVHGLFTRYQFHNRMLWLAMAFSMFCVANIIYNPWISPYFRAGPLNLVDWLYALGAAAIFITIRELQRSVSKRRRKPIVVAQQA